ncbi:Isochorismatase family protein [Lysinibacillus sp. AC-3]|nr:Isochorismatase family protein [Lysinibacillus sp. AC-3]
MCVHNSKSGRNYAKAKLIEGCVTATVKGALARNFAVTVVSDAVAGATDQSKEAALTKLATQDLLILTSQHVFER